MLTSYSLKEEKNSDHLAHIQQANPKATTRFGAPILLGFGPLCCALQDTGISFLKLIRQAEAISPASSLLSASMGPPRSHIHSLGCHRPILIDLQCRDAIAREP